MNAITSLCPVSDAKLDQIREETKKDINLKTDLEYTVTGWPTYKQDVKLAARDLFAIRSELSVCNGLLVKGDRIVIPYTTRKEILERIHDGHTGITKCRERANQSVWWPHVSKDIQDRVATCGHCLEKQPSQAREPMLPSSLPDRPFQKVDVDLCEFKGLQYLVIVDYYSRYIDLAHLPNIMSSMVVNKMKNSFAHHGIPETVISDNGTQFTSAEFKTFSVDWNFQHVTSSLHYPQSNREAERAVKTAKELLKQDDIFLALLTYRSTPIPDLGASPAELAFGRRLQTTLPSLPGTLTPIVNQEMLRERDAAFKQKQKRNYDHHHGVRPLPELHPGDSVFVKCDRQKGWKLPTETAEAQSEATPTTDNHQQQSSRSQRDNARTSLRS